MAFRLNTFLYTFFCLLLFSTLAPAQSLDNIPLKASPVLKNSEQQQNNEISDRLANWRGTLISTEQALSRSGLKNSGLIEKSSETSVIRIKALQLELELAPQVSKIGEQLNELGPKPGEGAPPETEEISKKRAELEENFSRLDGQLKAGRLIALRAAQIEQQIIDNRRQKFVTEISRHSTSLFDLNLWVPFIAGIGSYQDRLVLLLTESFAALQSKLSENKLSIPLIAAFIALFLFIAFILQRILSRNISRISRQKTDEFGPRFKIIRVAILSFLRDGLIPAAAVYFFYLVLSAMDLFTTRLDLLVSELFLVFSAILIAVALTNVYLRADNAPLRLAYLTNQRAKKLSKIIFITISIIGILRLAGKTAVVLVSPFEISVAFSALLSLVCFISVIFVLLTLAASNKADPKFLPIRKNIVRWSSLRILFWFSSIVGLIALFTGYIAFAEFLSWQILIAAIVFASLWLLIELLDLYRERFMDPEIGSWQKLANTSGFTQQSIMQSGVFGFGLTKLVILAGAAIVFLLSWGYRTGDWARPVSEAFFGFNIGGLSVSFSSIALAIVLFVIGYLFTRSVRFWLRNQFLPTTKLDQGLRNSIATVFGYVGIVLAALLAITAAGLDLSKVAIVAGALSVGIGFGLQSIVNNFVSGLILLAERPIKAGDWIVTGGGEGTVRKTSVRSTEIETFDGATVIVPNSTLITDAVTNWTHHTQKGRIIITIGVEYDSDPEQVRGLLLECARSHERIIENPAPLVFLTDFGADALLFQLRAYLADINNASSTKSDLRFAILKALRNAKIEIPYPQRDIHIKSAPSNLGMQKPPPKTRRSPAKK